MDAWYFVDEIISTNVFLTLSSGVGPWPFTNHDNVQGDHDDDDHHEDNFGNSANVVIVPFCYLSPALHSFLSF